MSRKQVIPDLTAPPEPERRILPLPEIPTGEHYKIQENSGGGWCDPEKRIISVPLADTPEAGHVRTHEMIHAVISPPGGMAKIPASVPNVAMQRAEDARVNHYAHKWGSGARLSGMADGAALRRIVTEPLLRGEEIAGVSAAVATYNTGDFPRVMAEIAGAMGVAYAERVRDFCDGIPAVLGAEPEWKDAIRLAKLTRDFVESPPEPEPEPEPDSGEDSGETESPEDGETEDGAASGSEPGDDGSEPSEPGESATEPEDGSEDGSEDGWTDAESSDGEPGEAGSGADGSPTDGEPTTTAEDSAPGTEDGEGEEPEEMKDYEPEPDMDLSGSAPAPRETDPLETALDGLVALGGTSKGAPSRAHIVTPALPKRLPPRLRGNVRRAMDRGTVPTQIHRFTSDKAIFGEKRKGPGGATLLIDCSGSMHFEDDDLMEVLELLPAALVATYAGASYVHPDGGGANGLPAGVHGEIRIVAKNGRRAADDQLRNHYCGGNVVDIPALEWLAKQDGPRYWICDGKISGQRDRGYRGIVPEAKEICRAARILRVRTIRDLTYALESGDVRKIR